MATTSMGAKARVWPALLFLLWNCLGVTAFVMQYNQDLVELAKTAPLQAKFWADMPGWAWTSYGIAVGSGMLGAIALLFRLKPAIWLSAICIVAVIVQFSYTFVLTDLIALKGFRTTLFPMFILVMAIAQLLYARSLKLS